eukprot:14325112-Ditylum_brightwellii.AAC.1
MQGPASYAVAKTLLKGNVLMVFEQAKIDHSNQTVPHFELSLDDVTEHVFPEKAGYLKDFPAHNGNCLQPLNKDKLLDILEYGVPASCHRHADSPKGKKPPKSENAGKCKAEDTTPTKPAGKRKFYCNLHGCNKAYNTEDCFEMKQCAKHAKTNMTQNEADKVTYKDLNAFVNAK